MRITSSIHSLNILKATNRALSRSLERTSNGVISFRDDPVRASIAQRISSKIRGLAQSNRNLSEEISANGMTQAGLDSLSQIINRMKDLAIEASNESLSQAERSRLQTAMTSLLAEYSNVVSTTTFNGSKLLDTHTLDMKLSNLARDEQGLLSFRTTQTFSENAGIDAEIASGDLDQDGNLDIVTMDADYSLHVRLGRGDGTFVYIGTFGAYADVHAGPLVLEDVNNDGILDVTGVATSGAFYINLGNGDGTFQENPVRYSSIGGAAATAPTFADFNDDGNLDAMISVGSGGFMEVEIFLGNGDGSFQDAFAITTGKSSTQAEIADLDGDGDIDIVTANSTGSNLPLSILLNDGSGNFSSSNINDGGLASNANDLAIGDFNGDNILDVSYFSNSTAYLYAIYGAGNGTFGAVTTLGTVASATGVSIQSADLDSNQRDDLVILTAGVGAGIHTFMNGTTLTTHGYALGSALNTSYEPELRDIDNDGDLDILGRNSNKGIFHMLNSSGSFSSASLLSGTFEEAETFNDFNNDGVLDIASMNSGGTSYSVYLQNTKSVSAVSDLRVDSFEAAQKTIEILSETVEKIIEAQSKIAITHSKLELQQDHQLILSESLDEARAKVEEIDWALELADQAALMIRQQAQVAVLSQSLIQQKSVLALLQDLF